MAAPERTVKITADGQLEETPLVTTRLLFIKGKHKDWRKKMKLQQAAS